VRCIKPNSLQAADTLQPELVEAQLRYSGLLETVRIRKAGYSLRMEFSLFWSRYRYLLPPTLSGAKVNDKCRDVIFFFFFFFGIGKEKILNYSVC